MPCSPFPRVPLRFTWGFTKPLLTGFGINPVRGGLVKPRAESSEPGDRRSEVARVRIWQAHDKAVCGLAFVPDGRTLATAGDGDPAVALWDRVGGGEPVR